MTHETLKKDVARMLATWAGRGDVADFAGELIAFIQTRMLTISRGMENAGADVIDQEFENRPDPDPEFSASMFSDPHYLAKAVYTAMVGAAIQEARD